MINKKIRVLIVDDSAFARKVIREVLSKDSEIEVVGYARDGLDAIEKNTELKPDVITLDLVMPDLDGVGFLKSFTAEVLPRTIIVSVSGSESELVIEALHLGAIDIVTKPTASATDRLYELGDELILKIKAAAEAMPKKINEHQSALPEVISVTDLVSDYKLMVLGTSTGGPQAISEIFNSLPANFPIPLVIALHIPMGYTESLAARISKTSSLKLVEAYDGMEIVRGQAIICPGGQHLAIKSVNNKLYASVSLEPLNTLYHPSIDLLFESAAAVVGKGVIGVILTGMGSDGTIGSEAIKNKGGLILAESESSCVVYGMPRSVIESGVASFEAPLDKMPGLMVRVLTK